MMFILLGSVVPSGTSEAADGEGILKRSGISITIYNDADLGNAARDHGSGGSGSKTDPYLFSGLTFTGSGTGLVIRNTVKHARFTDCVFMGGYSISGLPESGCGAYLYNCSYLKFSECKFIDNELFGSRSTHTDNISMKNCEFKNNGIGVDVRNSRTVILSGNSIETCQTGIHLQGSHYCTIEGNEVQSCQTNGISLYKSNRNIITFNLALRNGKYGISLGSSNRNTLYYNSLCYNRGTNETYIHSIPQAKDDSELNTWSDGDGKGNHYRDLMEPDLDWDGIVDISYWLDGTTAKDEEPLVYSKVDTVPSNPRSVCISVHPQGAFVNWTAPWDDGKLGIDSYSIYRSVNGEDMVMIDSRSAGLLSFLDEDVKEEFEYSYSIKAENSMGASIGTDPARKFWDIVPPRILDLFPGNGSYHRSKGIMIRWYCSDDLNHTLDHSLCLDGKWYHCGSEESFWTGSLSEGKHELILKVGDRGGNIATSTSTFYIDSEEPSISIFSPIDGEVLNTTEVQLQMLVSDRTTNITSLEISVDDMPWEDVPVNTEILDLVLDDGIHVITVRAMDMAGNEITEKVDLTIDTVPPEIINVSHSNGTVINKDTFLFKWEIEDNGSGPSYSMIKLDERDWMKPADLDRISLKKLNDGLHSISVMVFDIAENSVLRRYSFEIDTRAPWVEDHGPIGDDILSKTPIWFRFNEPIDNSTLHVSIGGFVITDIDHIDGIYTFVPPFDFVPGCRATVKISAADPVGNMMPEYSWSFYSGDPRYVLEGTVIGRIVNIDGEPVRDAFVFFTTLQYTMTNETGYFRFNIKFGNYTCRVTKEDYRELNFNISITGGEELLMDNRVLLEMEEAPDESKGLPMVLLVFLGLLVIILIAGVYLVVRSAGRRERDEKKKVEAERDELYSTVEIPADIADALIDQMSPEDEEAIFSITPSMAEGIDGGMDTPDLDLIDVEVETYTDTRRADLSYLDDEIEEMDWTELANPLYEFDMEDLPDMEDMDCFRKLGVAPGSSREEIRKSYRRLAALYHPDRISRFDPVLQNRAIEEMKRINYAKETLLGDIKRVDTGRDLLNSAKSPLDIR